LIISLSNPDHSITVFLRVRSGFGPQCKSFFSMAEPTAALPFEQIYAGILLAGLSPRDLRKLQYDSTFQAIRDRNRQFAFVTNFTRDDCKVRITSPQLADIFQISSGRVRYLLSTAAKRDFDHPTRLAVRPPQTS
jgi:hypothetical protein